MSVLSDRDIARSNNDAICGLLLLLREWRLPGDELVLVVADLLALGLVVRVLVLRVVLGGNSTQILVSVIA